MLGHMIYVVGAEGVRPCERFAIKNDQWMKLPKKSDFDEWGVGVTLMAVKSAYLLAIGGSNMGNLPDSERLRRLDVRRLDRGW